MEAADIGKIRTGHQRYSGRSVAAKPPFAIRERCGLNSQVGMSAFEDVFVDEPKLLVVFVDKVLLDAIRKSTHNEEVIIANTDSSRAVEDLLDFMSSNFPEGIRVVHIDP